MTTKKKPDPEALEVEDDGIVGGFPTGAAAAPEFTADQYEALAAEIPGALVVGPSNEPPHELMIAVPYPLAQRLRP